MEQPNNENNTEPLQQQPSGEDSILMNTINKLSSPAVYFFIAVIVLIITISMCLILFTGPNGINMSWLASLGLDTPTEMDFLNT